MPQQPVIPKVDQLEVLELLGEGGMSRVYKARQIALKRIVALKILSADLVGDPEGVQRFQREARLCSLLDHANIVKTLGFGISEDGQPYLLLEYLEGSSLAGEFKKGERLSFSRFKDIFAGLLSALAQAHEAGLVHRDIKPANIMLCRADDGLETVKLVDFGIAKEFNRAESISQHLTETGALLGSPAYMSPEQCDGRKLDGRSDLYSLACVMYEALCGEPPFSGDSPLEVMHRHLFEPPPTARALQARVDIKKNLAAAVVWGLAKDPCARPQSARELAKRLDAALARLDPDRVLSLRKDVVRRFPLRAVVFSLASAAVAVGLGCFLLNRQENVALSVHDLEVKAQRLEAANKHMEAMACYDQALLRLENNSLTRKKNIVLLLRNAVACMFGKNFSAEVGSRLLEYDNKGLALCLDIPDGPGGIDAINAEHYSFFCNNKCLLLKNLCRHNEVSDAGLEMLACAEKKWGAASTPALRARYQAALNFWESKRYYRAEDLAVRGLKIHLDKTRFAEKAKLQGMLARVYLMEHKTGEFLSVFQTVAKDLSEAGDEVKMNARLDAMDNLLELSELSHGLADIEPVLYGELKANESLAKQNPEYIRRISLAFGEYARYLHSVKDYVRARRIGEKALELTSKIQNNKIIEIRKLCLELLAAICYAENDLTGARDYARKLEVLSPDSAAPASISGFRYERFLPADMRAGN
jgi:serine/threonine protein kinase